MCREVNLIAFYLPQYHPIPENNRWWGEGFTEWNNVVKAKPLFSGHYQPHLPADLGFYDLRVPETRQAQVDLAKKYGISGFCYYHYWFHGKRLLERPFNEVLLSGQPDFPFCLCWANENWTRTWDGRDHQILIKQDYSLEDDRRHIQWLLRAFEDPRYIRVDGKPIFLVYRAAQLPDPLRTTSIWRKEASRAGIGDILLFRVESNFMGERGDPDLIGFDAAVEFQPDGSYFPQPMRRGIFWNLLKRLHLSETAFHENSIHDYEEFVELMLKKKPCHYRRYACVTPSWDNSPRRRKGASIFINSSPSLYYRWLKEVVQNEIELHTGEHIVFINAWNEWAEGNHLEPDTKFGLSYLDATKKALLDIFQHQM